MRFLAFFLAAALASFLGAAAAQAPPITVSTNNTPLDRKALQEISVEAFRRVGLEFRLISLPSERSLLSANNGEVDGEGLRVAGLAAQYPNLVQVPERYIGISFVAFARDPSIRVDKGWESLRSHSVAFITGWKMFEANATVARVVNRVEKPEQLFRMLEGGRIDLALYTRADGVALARSLGLADVHPLAPSLRDVDMYLYLHRRHEALVPRLAQALRDMKADGSYDRILGSLKAD
ncbi:MAG: transporter substrate-binding domain-containing protein [Rhodocyclaceae bacterium]|nr:transporter substrate-binding domain-containing protein [Rhodocyclaceae bacterium]